MFRSISYKDNVVDNSYLYLLQIRLPELVKTGWFLKYHQATLKRRVIRHTVEIIRNRIARFDVSRKVYRAVWLLSGM
jgi:hypothetical protein